MSEQHEGYVFGHYRLKAQIGRGGFGKVYLGEHVHLPLTSFVGRNHELEQLQSLLVRTRLLTLTGPGGCGKTRLALQLAFQQQNTFANGVCFVDLTPLSDPVRVVHAVASALGIREHGECHPMELLPQLLAEQHLLLVLDNCEQVVIGCARLARHLLQQCLHLHLLVTSREALSLPGEVLFPVPPLTCPPLSKSPSLEQLSAYEAVHLFVERAQAIAPSFHLTAENVSAVGDICRHLEGLPLALELAAARLSVLSPQQIAHRLSDRFRLLVNRDRLASPRHQTLYATIDWSYQLLSLDEQRLLRRLAVFVGSFSLEAVEAVCAAEDLASEELLDLLDHLVKKSLVQVVSLNEQEERRYRLLETIRQYSQQQLQAQGEVAAVEQRHATYFLLLAEESSPHLNEGNRSRWLSKLELEHDNLRAVLIWSRAAAERDEMGLRLVAALYEFWFNQGYWQEGRQWGEQVLADNHHNRASAALAKVYASSGCFAWLLGDVLKARTGLETSVALWRELPDHHNQVCALSFLGQVLIELGELAGAQTVLQESIALSQQSHERYYQAISYCFLGNVFREQHSYAQAEAAYEQSQDLFRMLEDRWGESVPVWSLGVSALRQGDYQRASTLFRESFRLCWHPDERWFSPVALRYIAAVVSIQGDARRAARLLGAEQAMREVTGVPIQPIYQAIYEQTLTAVRTALDEVSLTRAWEEGRAMTREQVYALAMTEDVLAPERGPSAPTILGQQEPSAPFLHLSALGLVHVICAGRELTTSDWKYAKVQELFWYLVSHGESTKERIGLALWPNASPTQLRNNLHDALAALRHALGRPEWIVYREKHYRFNRGMSYYYDVEAFEDWLRQARSLQTAAPAQAITTLERAIALYQGEFLMTLSVGDWADPPRDALRYKLHEALLLLAQLQVTQGQLQQAITTYRRLIEEDRLQEVAHRELMWCYAQRGERALALRHYRQFAHWMREEMHALPDQQTRALYERLRRGELLDDIQQREEGHRS